jgi:hypothetical protein
MPALGLEHDVVDRSVYDRTVERFRERKILLPTFAELAEPRLIPSPIRGALAAVKPDDANPLNLGPHVSGPATRPRGATERADRR